MKFKAWRAMNSSWCPWSFHIYGDFAIGQIAWGVSSVLPIFVSHCSIHSSDWFRDPVNYRFTCWIPGFLPQFS
jgi:hypothetical protein